ncbi:MAG: RNA methyltransferase [Planctomycetota bacterium]|jgi:tRNA(Leu) C34 or U34 (ribose-2'-O)-methylase TrmL
MPLSKRAARRDRRGYAAIGLYHPKDRNNVGSVLRACGCYGAAMVATTGRRYRRAPTDTMHTAKRIPLIQTDDLRSVIPFDCIPIAVEIVDNAKPINEFTHPDRAFYVFGPEDGSLGDSVLQWCHGPPVYIPTLGCMNLAAAVNVVLYDRWRQREK